MSLERLAAVVLDPGIPAPWLYAILFAGCALESFFPPWPADVVAVYSGFLAGRGVLHPSAVLLVAVVGTQSGVMGAFWVGRRWGRALLTGPMGRVLPRERLQELEGWFARYGAAAIVLSRFFPGVRALVTPAAGLAGVATWKVWVFAGASVVLWNLFVVGLGLLAGIHLEWALRVLRRYNTLALAGLGLGLVLLAAVAAARRRRARGQGR